MEDIPAPDGWAEITVIVRRPDRPEFKWSILTPTHLLTAILCSARENLEYNGTTQSNILVVDYGGEAVKRGELFDIIAASVGDASFRDYVFRVKRTVSGSVVDERSAAGRGDGETPGTD